MKNLKNIAAALTLTATLGFGATVANAGIMATGAPTQTTCTAKSRVRLGGILGAIGKLGLMISDGLLISDGLIMSDGIMATGAPCSADGIIVTDGLLISD